MVLKLMSTLCWFKSALQDLDLIMTFFARCPLIRSVQFCLHNKFMKTRTHTDPYPVVWCDELCCSLQPQLYNEVFDDDLEGHGGGGEAPLPKASSPRQEYMSLAAVPRFSRPSMELQVPGGAAGGLGSSSWCLCSWRQTDRQRGCLMTLTLLRMT